MNSVASATFRASAELAARPGPRRAQAAVVGTAALLLLAGVVWLAPRYGARHAGLFLVGAGCGLVLYQAAFGFTAAFRVFVTQGDGRGIRAQMLMLAVATVLFAPMLSAGELLGTSLGGAVAPAGVSVLVGAFMFAVGMQLGGGCGSGTLFHLGSGATPMALTLAAFIAGAVIATFHMPFWSAAPSLGEIALADRVGWPGAVGLQLAALALIAAATWVIERRRFGPRQAVPAPTQGWARVLHGPWPLAAGAVALAGLNALTLVLAGHPWGITWAFALWGAKALEFFGYDLSTVPFWSGEFQQAALAEPVLADVTSVMDLGIVLGAALGAGLAGRFAPRRRIPPRIVAASVLGGLLLGYGSRIAFGCNIGAYFGGIASTSLHGWLWGAAALLGTPVGVALRTRFGVGENRTTGKESHA
jgi:uncharacterized membrane protein YedE/YeeE